MRSRIGQFLDKHINLLYKLFILTMFLIIVLFPGIYIIFFKPYLYQIYIRITQDGSMFLFEIILYFGSVISGAIIIGVIFLISKLIFKQAQIICPYCGTINTGDKMKCIRCGENMRIFKF